MEEKDPQPLSEEEGRELHDILARMFVGQERDDAFRVCKLLGLRSRVLRIDGKGCMKTCDYDVWRFNFHIAGKKITEVSFG